VVLDADASLLAPPRHFDGEPHGLKTLVGVVDAPRVNDHTRDGADRSQTGGDQSCARTMGRRPAFFLGRNDAAWGRPRRFPPGEATEWYARGYAGGLAFRRARSRAPDP
jgi:hypothetical protein